MLCVCLQDGNISLKPPQAPASNSGASALRYVGLMKDLKTTGLKIKLAKIAETKQKWEKYVHILCPKNVLRLMAARKQKRPWPPNCELCNFSSLTSVSGVLQPPRSCTVLYCTVLYCTVLTHQRLWRAVPAPQPRALGQGLLQLEGGAAGDQLPQQSATLHALAFKLVKH